MILGNVGTRGCLNPKMCGCHLCRFCEQDAVASLTAALRLAEADKMKAQSRSRRVASAHVPSSNNPQASQGVVGMINLLRGFIEGTMTAIYTRTYGTYLYVVS